MRCPYTIHALRQQGRGYDDLELCVRDFEVRVGSEINSKEVLSQLDKVFRDVVSVDGS